MSDSSRPVIDLPIVDMSKTKTDRAGLAKIVVDALENIGFLFIDNVEGLDFDRLFQACKWFFSLPPEKKRVLCRKNWVPENKNIYRGYFPVVEGEPSRKEGFEFGRAVDPNDVQVSSDFIFDWLYVGKHPFGILYPWNPKQYLSVTLSKQRWVQIWASYWSLWCAR